MGTACQLRSLHSNDPELQDVLPGRNRRGLLGKVNEKAFVEITNEAPAEITKEATGWHVRKSQGLASIESEDSSQCHLLRTRHLTN